ncbi:MAG: hypothetical protein A2W18_08590 [Candidatus Muproteobacteria bacterium RBG_16_60_9]|uniref:Uncharacterized protein n=1 Tax=Candidatus Muproteobacteria bacterium RBG_16_60_9 TaxID=1817755 RepID=A0A1F6VH47_9PROT|nr:MAG: hypothetical protein A2W18_08590 [Candidatus Muproteobacteria bacterium RBG_16_60_9]
MVRDTALWLSNTGTPSRQASTDAFAWLGIFLSDQNDVNVPERRAPGSTAYRSADASRKPIRLITFHSFDSPLASYADE